MSDATPREESQTVEREIRIAASPETVFSFFTDPSKVTLWKGTSAFLDPRPGGIFRVAMKGSSPVRGEFVEVVPHSRVVFTWGWEGDDIPLPPGASTVEVSLVPDGDGTLVNLRHTGLPASGTDDFARGWDHYLPRLQTSAEGRNAGPDPWESQADHFSE